MFKKLLSFEQLISFTDRIDPTVWHCIDYAYAYLIYMTGHRTLETTLLISGLSYTATSPTHSY